MIVFSNVSRQTAIKVIPDLKNVQVISFNDTKTEINQIMALPRQDGTFLHTLISYDVDEEGETGCFTAKQADDMLEVIDKALRCQRDILVHCFMGVSRSAAVVKFLKEYTTASPSSEPVLYNSRVYAMLKQASKRQEEKTGTTGNTYPTDLTPNDPQRFPPTDVYFNINIAGDYYRVMRPDIVAQKTDDQIYVDENGRKFTGKFYWGWP